MGQKNHSCHQNLSLLLSRGSRVYLLNIAPWKKHYPSNSPRNCRCIENEKFANECHQFIVRHRHGRERWLTLMGYYVDHIWNPSRRIVEIILWEWCLIDPSPSLAKSAETWCKWSQVVSITFVEPTIHTYWVSHPKHESLSLLVGGWRTRLSSPPMSKLPLSAHGKSPGHLAWATGSSNVLG